MINQDILKTLDSAIDDLNRVYFASFDLTQDERKRFNDSIKKLEDLKLIIESKNNQVESKNKHIKRLERIISNIKRKILIEHDSGRQSCPTSPLTKRTCRLLLGTSQNSRQYRQAWLKLGLPSDKMQSNYFPL